MAANRLGVAKLNNKEREWVEARQRYNLSHAQVQMGRELEIIPRSLAKVTEGTVAESIAQLYLERFGRAEPEVVTTIENRAKQEQRENALEKIAQKKAAAMAKIPEPEPKPVYKHPPKPRKKNRPEVSIPRPPRKR